MANPEKKKVMLVFGTRPEAVKMCPLVRELKSRAAFDTVVCVTGQHRQMLEQVLQVFDMVPDYDLDIMKQDQSLFDITVNVLDSLRGVLEAERPDLVLVHGDTSTAYAAALACFYLKIPVGHVEAGLRTYDLGSPFPEEFNRASISMISRYHFVPTQAARENLLREHIPAEQIYVTGNTVIDALKATVTGGFTHPELSWAEGSRMILVTAHRRENLGQPIRNIFRGIRRVVEAFSDIKVVYPIHLNDQIRQIADQELGGCERIHIIEPLDVVAFHNFESRSYLILTDSGGVQEEAPTFGIPVLVMRDTTERPEGLLAGTAILTGTSEESIYSVCSSLLSDDGAYRDMTCCVNPYGDGNASRRIADVLEFGAVSI